MNAKFVYTIRALLALALIAVMIMPTVAPVASALVSAQPVKPPIGNNTTIPAPIKPAPPSKLPAKPPVLHRPTEPTQPINQLLQPPKTVAGATGGSSSGAPVTVVVGKTPAARSPKSLLDAKKLYTVYLITGDKVTVFEKKDGKVAVFIQPTEPGKKFHILRARGDIYVIPLGVDLHRFSIDLFNLRLLKQYNDLGLHKLPLIIKFSKPLSSISSSSSLGVLSALPHVDLGIINAVAVRVPYKELPVVYRQLASSPDVAAVTLDKIVKPQVLDKEPDFFAKPSLYQSVPMIGAPVLWNMGFNGTGIKIAILDTGIDPTHPDFYIGNKSKIIMTASFVDLDGDGNPDQSVIDGNGHGTHCAGIAAGTGGYLPIIKGVAPAAEILAGKVLANEGYGYDSWIINGIQWAVQNGANVISMSLGGPPSLGYDPLVDAVNQAFKQGVVVVVAAGNEGPGFFTAASPGVAEGALTVGAVDKQGNLAWFSSWGPGPMGNLKPDVVAPGVDIASARANGTYMGEPATRYHVYASGTSMATPHVAGLAALVLQAANETGILSFAESYNITPSELVKDIIVATATPHSPDENPYIYGAGIVNATKIAMEIENQTLVIPDPARADIILGTGNETVTIRVYNPWNHSITLALEPYLIKFPYTEANLSSDAVTISNATLVVPAKGYANLTIVVDSSKIPVGFHALRILMEEGNETVAQALIGISKPAYAVLHVTNKGQPVDACLMAIGLHVSGELASYGFIWSDTELLMGPAVQACGTNGTITVGPLYPDTVYIADVYPLDGTLADYYVPIAVPSDLTEPVINVSLDFSDANATSIVVPPDLGAQGLIAYSAALVFLQNGSVAAALPLSTAWGFGGSNTSTIYLGGVDKAPISIDGVTALLVPYYFAVVAYTQPTPDAAEVLNATLPVDVFYRAYSDIPAGQAIVVQPGAPEGSMTHVHSALGPAPLLDANGLAIWCGPVDIASIPLAIGVTGSETLYNIDTNTNITTCSGAALDDVYASTVEIVALDFYGYSTSSGLVYAPLRMPRGSTTWMYFYAYQGLDKYNFTGALTAAHLFRSTIFGSFDIYSNAPSPLAYMLLRLNGGQASTAAASAGTMLPMIEYWFAHNGSRAATADLIAFLNTSALSAAGIGFFNDTASMIVHVETGNNYTVGARFLGFYYGLGVREIVPLSGYDPLRNMLMPNSIAWFAVLFNQPNSGYLLNNSVEIRVVGHNTSRSMTIAQWSQFGPLPMAYAALNTTGLPAGAYTLVITGKYYDPASNTTATFNITLSPALYIGKAAGPLFGPHTVRVGPPGSGADYTSIAEAVASAPAGSTIEILPGNYTEEMIVVDKPLVIRGTGGVVVTTPHGYPAFIVLAPAVIENLAIEPAPGQLAQVPTGFTAVPGDALVPPAAVIAYNAPLAVYGLTVYGYPVGVGVYGGSLKASGVTAYLTPAFIANNMYSTAANPAPIYTYKAETVSIANVESSHLPLIAKTPWQAVEVANVTIDTGSSEVPVAVVKNETISLTSLPSSYAILLGSSISLQGINADSIEAIGDNLVVNGSTAALFTSTAAAKITGSTIAGTLYSTVVSIENASIEGLVVKQPRVVEIINSTAVGMVAVDAQPASTIVMEGNRFSDGHPAAVYVVLRDASVFNFTNNLVEDSTFGVYVVPLYSQSAPEINILNNTFNDVAVPVYIAGSQLASAAYYIDSLQEPTEPRLPAAAVTPSYYLLHALNSPEAVSKTVIEFNKITGAAKAVVATYPTELVMVKNIIEANETGVEGAPLYIFTAFFNNISAPTAIKLVNSYGLLSFNNLYGKIVLQNNTYADLLYNYVAGGVEAEASSLGENQTLVKPVEIPSTNNLIVPVFYPPRIYAGSSTELELYFLNPTTRKFSFQYSLSTLGAVTLSGETQSTAPVQLDGVLGTGPDTLAPEISLKALAPGTAALKVKIVTDTSYTLVMPFEIKGANVTLMITAPSTVQRGQVFPINVTIESSTSGSFPLTLGQSGTGLLGFCSTPSCSTYSSTYSTTVTVSPGNTTVTLYAVALHRGSVEVEASIYVGLVGKTAKASIAVEPNPSLAPSAVIDYYPSSVEQGYYDYISVRIDNVSLPTRIRIEATALNGYIDVLNGNVSFEATWWPWYSSIAFYASTPGNETVNVKVYDVDDGVLVLDTNVSIRVTPSLLYGYTSVYGAVSTAAPSSRANLTLPNTTVYADLWTYVSLSQETTSLAALDNLISNPWGCVEQTTSPTLAAIELYRYLDTKNLWDQAAEAMGYTNGTALRDRLVGIVSDGVERLLEVHGQYCAQPDVAACGFGWYPGLQLDLFFTPYGLLGLLKAYEFQSQYNLSLYSNVTRWNTTIEKLVRGLIEHQNSDGSWGYSWWSTERKVYYTSFALQSLVKAYTMGYTPYNETPEVLRQSILNATAFLEKATEDAISLQGPVGEVIASLYALTEAAKAGISVNATVLSDAVNYITSNAGQADGMAWWWGSWPHYSLSSYLYLTTAKAAVALYNAANLTILDNATRSLASQYAAEATKFLIVNLDWVKSYDTFEAAAVLDAVNTIGATLQLLYTGTGSISYIIRAGGPSGAVLLNVTIPGNTTWWSCYIPDLTSVSTSDYWYSSCQDSATINYVYQGNWLSLAKTLYIEVSADGNLSATWYADTIYAYYETGTSTGSAAPVRTVYLATSKGMIPIIKQTPSLNTTSASSLIDIEKQVTPSVVNPGDTVKVRLVIRSKQGTLNYVIVSDPLPPGYQLINSSINITPAGLATVDWEYYNRHNGTALGFAIASLNETGVVIEYELRVPANATLGTVETLSPANATLFYVPSGQQLEPAVSNTPTVTIGVSAAVTAKSMFYTSSLVANNSQVRWGEVLNISVTLTGGLPTAGLQGQLVVMDENRTVVSTETFDMSQGWVPLVTSDLASLSVLEKLAGKPIYIVVAVKNSKGEVLASKTLKLTLLQPTSADFDDMLANLGLFWLNYGDKPWFPMVFDKLLEGLSKTWLLIG